MGRVLFPLVIAGVFCAGAIVARAQGPAVPPAPSPPKTATTYRSQMSAITSVPWGLEYQRYRAQQYARQSAKTPYPNVLYPYFYNQPAMTPYGPSAYGYPGWRGNYYLHPGYGFYF